MKDQNDDNQDNDFVDDSDASGAMTPDDTLNDFDQEDLSQFDDIHEEYEDSDDQNQSSTEDPDEEEISEDEAYANLDDSAAAKNANKSAGIVSLIKENWLYVSLGLIILIVAGYLIKGEFSPSTPAARPVASAPAATPTGFNKLPTDQQSTTSTTTVTNTGTTTDQTNAAPVTTTTTTGTVAAAGPTISMSETQMQQLLQGFSNTVQDSMKSVQKTIQSSGAPATNEKLAALQDQLSSLNGNISTLNNNLSTADTRLSTTQQQLSQVLAQETADQQKLTLRAVVPGRAWLVDGKGNTVSVTVGSSLGNIGIVTEIDSDQDNSQVVTSSGYIFK